MTDELRVQVAPGRLAALEGVEAELRDLRARLGGQEPERLLATLAAASLRIGAVR